MNGLILALCAATSEVAIHTLSVPIALDAGAGGDGPIRTEILPPPDADGRLPCRDGRVQRVPDMAALAAAINGQQVAARVDFDHQSERSSPTFRGSTAAEGWIGNARVNARGGLDADLTLSAYALARIRMGEYRYLSPGVMLNVGGVVEGLSSVALVNDPNFTALRAPAVHAGAGQSAPDAQLAERERRADERDRAAIVRALDSAIGTGRILPRDRGYHETAIAAHADGIDAGLRAFEAHAEGALDRGPGMADLTRRTGPRGAPARTPAGPPVHVPTDYVPAGPERMELHARIGAHAATRNISYRDAVVEIAAMGGTR